MYKNPAGASGIITSKICSTKQISESVSNFFKLVYNQIENFKKLLDSYQIIIFKFWILQNSDPIIQSLNNINKKSESNLLCILQQTTF